MDSKKSNEEFDQLCCLRKMEFKCFLGNNQTRLKLLLTQSKILNFSEEEYYKVLVFIVNETIP